MSFTEIENFEQLIEEIGASDLEQSDESKCMSYVFARNALIAWSLLAICYFGGMLVYSNLEDGATFR